MFAGLIAAEAWRVCDTGRTPFTSHSFKGETTFPSSDHGSHLSRIRGCGYRGERLRVREEDR